MNHGRNIQSTSCRRFAAASLLAAVAFAGASHAQTAPVNDLCPQAISLGTIDSHDDFVTHRGSTNHATRDGISPCSSTSNTPDVWYTVFASFTGPMTIDTCGSAFDTVISVYRACPQSGGTVIACNDNATVGDCANTATSSVTINANGGTQYWIRVAGRQATGQYSIRVAPGQAIVRPVANETCQTAQLIEYGDHPFNIVSAGTNGSVGNPMGDCNGRMRNDVWFSFRACSTGQVTASTCTGTFWDSMIEVYRGSCNSNARIACSEGGCGGVQASATFQTVQRETYYIRVGAGPNATYVGDGILTLSGTLCAPSNDTCSEARPITITATPTTFVGTTLGAARDGTSSCGFTTTSPDVWYSFDPSGLSSNVTIETCGTDFDTILSVHTGCPGDTSNMVVCNDNTTVGDCAGSRTSRVTFYAAARNIYKIRVTGANGASGPFTLRTIRGSAFPIQPAPSNDLCSNARRLAPGATSAAYSTMNAATDGPSRTSIGDCVGAIRNDVWFLYPACTTGTVTLRTCAATSQDSMIGVYTGACSSPTLIACNNNACGLQSTVTFAAVAGRTYLIRVGVDPSYQYEGAGTLMISAPPCYPISRPPNDRRDFATPLPYLPGIRTVNGSTVGATNDGSTTCGQSNTSPDVWYTLFSRSSGLATLELCGETGFDTVLSVHNVGIGALPLVCSDNAVVNSCSNLSSVVSLYVTADTSYLVRVSGNNNTTGTFALRATLGSGLVEGPEFCPCDWNIDHTLDSADFFAFLNDFMAGAADFNNSGEIDSRDLFDFIDCFMTRPGVCAN